MIYFDHNSTTPPDADVLRAAESASATLWGNPSSPHLLGQEARAALNEARAQVAALGHVAGSDVIFTSGGSEAACQVLLGGDALTRPRHLITSAIEHPCVLSAASALEAAGWRVTRLPVDRQGRVNPDDVRTAISKETALISVMTANNDTGVIQPVAAIGDIARSEAIPFHTDAVQAAGKIHFDIQQIGADFATISAHKFQGPKGCGAVLLGSSRRPSALIRGGEQEWGLRAGTENVPALVGMGIAARLATERLALNIHHTLQMRLQLEGLLRDACPDLLVHGAEAERLPNTLYVAFPGVRGSSLAMRLDLEGIAVSTTSACSSRTSTPPHVLIAMGVPPSLALSSLRFSLGGGNSLEEVEQVAKIIARIVPELRRA